MSLPCRIASHVSRSTSDTPSYFLLLSYSRGDRSICTDRRAAGWTEARQRTRSYKAIDWPRRRLVVCLAIDHHVWASGVPRALNSIANAFGATASWREWRRRLAEALGKQAVPQWERNDKRKKKTERINVLCAPGIRESKRDGVKRLNN